MRTLFVTLAILAGFAFADWEIETVDSAGNVGLYTSLALDSSDNPHISYKDQTNYDLKYACWSGSSWEIESVDSAGNVGSWTSLALDSLDNPHISYHDWTNHDLKFALWNGSFWEVETVHSISGGYAGMFCSLALNSSGNPNISYIAQSLWDTSVRYAHWNGSSWDLGYVCYGYGEAYTSLALDSLDNPHICHCNSEFGSGMIYTCWNGYSWESETVDSASDVGWHNSLALDSSSNPNISYYDEPHGDLKYAYQTETSIEEGEISPVVTFDISPNPFSESLGISYSLPETGQVELSVYDLTGRLVENLESDSAPAGEHTSVWAPDPEFPNGCYLIVLDACGERAVRRCVKL